MNRFRAITLAALVLIAGGLLSRLLAEISQAETGLETVSRQWREATLGFLLGKSKPLAERRPEEQADYWLAETERIVRDHPDEAKVAMGAALILHRSSPFGHREIFENEGNKGLERAVAEFDARCNEASLEFAARATRLEPRNLDWWRLRALLLRKPANARPAVNSRDERWLDVLAECRRNDPDNSLYDYVEAIIYWDECTSFDPLSFDDDWLVIHDAGRWRLGAQSLERGLAKRQFLAPNDIQSALFHFLSHSKLSLVEQEQIGRFCTAWHPELLRNLLQRQTSRAIKHAAADDVAAAMPVLRQNLLVLDQYYQSGSARAYEFSALGSKSASTHVMLKMIEKHGWVVSPQERQRIESAYRRACVQALLLRHVYAHKRSAPPDPAPPSGYDRWSAVINLLVESLPFAIPMLAVMAGAVLAISRLCGKSALRPPKAAWRGMALFVAFVVTVVACSLAPLEVIPRDVQAWCLSILIISPFLLLATYVAYRGVRRRQFKISLRALLLGILILSMFFGVVSIARRNARSLPDFPFDLSLAKYGGDERPGAPRKIGLLEMIEEWIANRGHFATVALWAMLATALYAMKVRTARRSDLASGWRDRLACWTSMIGGGLATLAALLLVAYLALAPWNVRFIEYNFQQHIAFVRRPGDDRSKVDALTRKFESDKQFVRQLEVQVDAETAKERAANRSR